MAEIVRVNALKFIIDEAVDALTDIDVTNTKIVWFGLTAYVEIIQRALILKGKRIHHVIDNNAEKWGWIVEDLVVFPVRQIVDNYKENAVFLISSRFKNEMLRQLIDLGVAESSIIILPCHDESSALAREFLLKQTAGLKEIGLREYQLIMLELLKIIRDFCTATGLRYFLAAGTLLGAVRHKGFVPWDDDADVYLPFRDYRKFIETFPDDGRYEVVNWEKNTDFFFDVAKIVDNNTVLIHGGYPVAWIQGISICVLPLSGYPDDESCFEQKKLTNSMLDSKWYQYQNAKDIITDGLQDLRRDICDAKYSMPFDDSPLIGRTHVMHRPVWTVPQSVFAGAVSVEFEGELFSAPIGYDAYLKAHYGDYMQVPSDDDREAHEHLPFWKPGIAK